MFAHKEISRKVRKPIRFENSWHLLVWIYHERCVHILYAKALNVFYAVSVLIFQNKNFSSPVIIPCHVLIKVKNCVRMLSTLLRFDPEQKTEGISTRVFPLESPSKIPDSVLLSNLAENPKNDDTHEVLR